MEFEGGLLVQGGGLPSILNNIETFGRQPRAKRNTKTKMEVNILLCYHLFESLFSHEHASVPRGT